MSVVVGTAGHIDHGKTTLLRSLTGIDADRLPEERRRGMTIDVGYAHLALPDGSVIDFVDVPGHDRLVGNMLVGAGEIDAALVVVAADDGPNAQTIEHLELLDALGIHDGLAVVTKADLATEPTRREELVTQVTALLSSTTLAGARVLLASATTGEGLDAVRDALAALAGDVAARMRGEAAEAAHAAKDAAADAPRLAIDRVFAVRGRGTVVTGSLRGGTLRTGAMLALVPDGGDVRVRELQARGLTVDASDGGRTAVLVGGMDASALRRGMVLTSDPRVVATSRVLVRLTVPAPLGVGTVPRSGGSPGAARGSGAIPPDRSRLRLHLGTEQTGALVVRGPREAIDLDAGSSIAILRLDATVAAAPGDRFALRWPSPAATAAGGIVLDPAPPRGISRRRLTPERAAALAADPGSPAARLELHGALRETAGWRLARTCRPRWASELEPSLRRTMRRRPNRPGCRCPRCGTSWRTPPAVWSRSRGPRRPTSRGLVIDGLIADGMLARDGDRVRDASRAAGLPSATLAAMDRLEAALSVAGPPPLSAAAAAAGCPRDGVRALESAGRIVRLEDDLAWSAATYRELAGRAVSMAAAGPLTPAALREAMGTSRRYVMVIIEDLDRRGLLRRTDAGHVLGPRTLERLRARTGGPSAPGGGAPSAPGGDAAYPARRGCGVTLPAGAAAPSAPGRNAA